MKNTRSHTRLTTLIQLIVTFYRLSFIIALFRLFCSNELRLPRWARFFLFDSVICFSFVSPEKEMPEKKNVQVETRNKNSINKITR